MSSKKSDNKKVILIIGAGAGAHVARHIAPKVNPALHEIILVEPLAFKAILPATLRMVVTAEGKLESTDKAFVPLDKVFSPGQPGRVVQDQVLSVSVGKDGAKGEAVMKSGDTILYDILVFATGSKWTGPIAFPWFEGKAAVTDFIEAQRAKIGAAKHVVLAGAGAVGIELAGEITNFYPNTKVTLVQGDSAVLNAAYPEKLKRAVVQRLKAKNVDVIYNDYIDNFEEGTITKVVTRNGKEIKADLVLSTRGPKPNTDLFQGTPFASALTQTGTAKIRPTFQVQGFDNVFAVGDIIEWKEQKMAAKQPKHGAIAGDNILALLNNGGKGMKEYKGQFELMVLTFGPDGGVAYFDLGFFSLVFGDWLAKMFKSRSLMLPLLRPVWGQK